MLKKFLSVTLSMVISISVFVQSSAFANEPVFSGDKETYVVLTETAKDGKEIISDYDGEAIYNNETVSCELTERQADKLEDQPGVLAVSEDIILTGTGKQIESKKHIKNEVPEQWNLDAIGVSKSDTKSSDVKIEVLDSGVSYTDDINIQSSVNLVPGEEEVSPMFVDANGHGTGIAGLIGAKDNNDGIKGVYPNAEIYSVKALDENLKSPLSRIVEGIYWGIENDMDIINMSFGTNVNTDVLHEAVKAAADAGIILIAAAGNTEHQSVNYPAAYNEVIAVGSINAEGELAELTSTGTQLELLAPGEQVYTTGLFYGTIGVSGTSIATAQVTGTAAMLKAKDKTKSADFIRGLLKASSKEVEGTGAGLIDYNYALDIYDEYVKNYIEGENIDNEFENTEEISDYSDDADVVVEGLWDKDEHEDIAKNATKKYGTKEVIDNIDYIKKGANEADSALLKGDYKCKNLHGKNNYVASLRFLWRFAKLIGKGNSLNDAKKDAISKLPSKLLNNDSSYDTMADNIVKYIKNKHSNYTKKQKMYYVMGLTCHLLSDTYAHRMIVPSSSVSNNSFKKSDFTSDSKIKTFDENKLKNLAKEAYKKMQDENNKKYRRWEYFVKTVKLGVMEFMDIKYYMKSDEYSKTNKIYEDNVAFYKKRYNNAVDAVEYYIDHYKDAFDESVFIPIYRDSIKLNNLYGYIKELGINTSYFTTNEWKGYSTMAYV